MNPLPKASLRVCAQLSAVTLLSPLFVMPAHAHDDLDSITVTANRMPTENALAPTTVISRNDIDRLQINDLPTLLSRFPGVDMTQSGGLGKASNISIRGSNTDQVLVLVDGVKWYSATSGGTALQNFPVEQIERIEIVRGSRSGVYGSEAIGGVIQIFTRKGKNAEPKAYFSLAAGTKNTQRGMMGIHGGDDTTRYNVSYSYDSTNGINAREDKNPDHDGYESNNVNINADHDVTDNWNIGFNFLRTQGTTHTDGFVATEDNYADIVQQIVGINNRFLINDWWSLQVDLSESRDEYHDYADKVSEGTFNTRHRNASFVNNFIVSSQHQFNLGFDYDEDTVDSTTTDYAEDSRDNKAVFASWQADFNPFSMLLSARHDNNEAYGEQTTGTADFGVFLMDDLELFANVGTGFRTPTFNMLYWPFSGRGFRGNPDLKPEKSKNYGVGIRGEQTWGGWSAQAYQNEIRDLLNYQGNQYVNVNEAKIKGVEVELHTTLFDWDVSADASFLKPEDEKTGNILARRAQRFANLHIDKQWSRWSTGASWKLRDHSYDNASNTTRLAGYGLLDLRVGYKIDSAWAVRLTGQNMLNKDYQTVNTYESLGRTVMLSVHYQP